MRIAERAVAPVLDGLLIAGSIWLLPLLRALLDEPPLVLAVPIALAYLGLCGGLWLLRLIAPPAPPARYAQWQSCALGMLTFAYAVFALGMLIYTLSVGSDRPGGGVLERLPQEHPLLFMLVLLLMLVWIALFPAAALSRPQPRFAAGTPAALAARTAGLWLVNCMALFTGAWIQTLFAAGGAAGLPLGGRLLLFALYYIVFLLFYAPPRLALIAVDGDRYSLYSLLLMLGFFVWPLTA